MNSSTQNTDDVYNFLNESGRVDASDIYDHAKPVPAPSTLSDDGYGVVAFASGDVSVQNKENNQNSPIGGNKTSNENVENDDYFVLEKQTV
jgi:hypothetical protein